MSKFSKDDYMRRFEGMVAQRTTWDEHFEELAQFCYPRRRDFVSKFSTPGEKKMQHIYDATPIHAAELLASGLHGMLTNPASEWFTLQVNGVDVSEDIESQRWLDSSQTSMYSAINAPTTGFTTHMHECYMEYVIFGTCVLYVGENHMQRNLLYDAIPLSQCYIAENMFGVVDTLYREFPFTVRQLVHRWGLDKVSGKVRGMYENNKFDDEIQIIHAVQPNRDFYQTRKSKKAQGWVSCYLEKETRHKVVEGVFHEFPYMVPRFYKASGETYGRSPAMTALPDIKMLNEMQKTIIRASQKIVDPPLLLEDDGLVSPVRTIPSGITYYRAGSEKPSPLETGANIPLGLELTNEIRNRIREMFFNDQLQLREGPQMTATEVIQRTEERLRLLGPVLGRLQQEFLGPQVTRVFNLLRRNGTIPEPPDALSGGELRVEYTSPVALAQKQLEAQGIMRTMEVMAPFIETDPDTLDTFNNDRLVRSVAAMFGVNPHNLNSQEEVASIREGRAEAAAEEQAGTQAREQSGALKNAAGAMALMDGLEGV